MFHCVKISNSKSEAALTGQQLNEMPADEHIPNWCEHFLVRRAVSSSVTCCEEVFAQLASVFAFESSTDQKQRVFVITGLEGVGKSEICLKFAHDHQVE